LLKPPVGRAILPRMGPRGRAGELIVRSVGSETIVYERRTHRAHCLGPVAAAVWQEYCSGGDAAGIAERLSSRGEPLDQTTVAVALRRLERAGLVEPGLDRRLELDAAAPPGAADEAGRRAALRRVATLTGLAVLSIVTPAPAQVATCLPNGSSCTNSGQCCNACCNAQNFKCTGGGPCLPGAAARR